MMATMFRMGPRTMIINLTASLLIIVQLATSYSLDLTSEGQLLWYIGKHQ